MNLLITNTREDQAYLILRSLRAYAGRVVITLDGSSALKRWSGMSAWSRLVDKRYRVPDCAADWRSGAIRPDNTPAEEAYIQRIEEVCALERIDCAMPSYDAEVYVFSKNKQRLAAQGVTALVPDFDGLTRILDKSLTLAAAEQAGFPVPRTRVVADRDGLQQAAGEIEPPWVLKPRCDAHAANIEVARNRPELEQAFDRLSRVTERPLLQEFVPSVTKRNYYVMVNPAGEVLSLLSPRVRRTRKTGLRTPCAAVETTAEIPFEPEIRSMLRILGAWGGLTIQSNVDERDQRPKLMEINPRFGHALWYRTELGINEPLILLRLMQGEEPGPIGGFPEDVLLLDPLWDLMHLAGQSVDQSWRWLRSAATGRRGAAMPFAGEPLGALLRNLRREYFGPGTRVTSPLNRGYLTDPLPPLARIVRVFCEAIGRRAS
jgi:biotin carboxylase